MRIQFCPGLLAAAMTLFFARPALAEEATIDVKADRVLHAISPHLTGACVEDVNHEVYGGIYSQMIFGESFQEPPPASTLRGFKSYDGAWTIHDGEVRIDAGDGPKLVSDHPPFRDGAVGVEMYFAEAKGQNAGLLIRVQKPGIGADAFTGYEVSLDAAGQTLLLGRHRRNFEPIKRVHCEVALRRWIALEARVCGSIIEIVVDGKSALRYDDGPSALAAGGVALRAWHRQASYRGLWVNAGRGVEPLSFSQAENPTSVSGMWRAMSRGNALARNALVADHPFAGTQSQQMVFESGQGEIGIENQGLNRWGMNFVGGKAYEGYVWARADKPITLIAAMESADGAKTFAEQSLNIASGDWQRLDLRLTPNASDSAGRLSLKLKQPGSVTLGHVFFQPGDWGRFKGLPVRRDVAEGLIAQGVTILRYGGSMVNKAGYNWKNMIGPRDRRPPYLGLWYRYSTNGWGIGDFMNFCEAAGFEYVPAFNMGETPADMADFIDYAKAPADSEWGRKRGADGHPAPYRLHYMELGNEERVDERYAAKFEALAGAIWAKDPKMILVVGDFAYNESIVDPFHITGAAAGITTLAGQQRILKFAKERDGEVWFDVHVNTDHPVAKNASLLGMFSYADALDKLAEGARHRVVVFEFNSGNHAQKRALANAQAINAIERDGRMPIVCVANCLQPDKQNDNGWDQGLLFLNPSQVWLQPPGYLTQMYSKNYQPQLVQCDVSANGTSLDVVATRSEDGKTLVLQVVNPGDAAVSTRIAISGFRIRKPEAGVTCLSGAMEASNTAERPDAIMPTKKQWPHKLEAGPANYEFPAHSATTLRLE